VRTSPFRSAAYSLHCKTEKFEAILFPRRSRRWCLRTADHRAPVPEAAAVHPKCAKSSSGAHARPSRAKADTPHCSAISTTSYCRRPRPALISQKLSLISHARNQVSKLSAEMELVRWPRAARSTTCEQDRCVYVCDFAYLVMKIWPHCNLVLMYQWWL
jgi:hypothetical protein